MVSTLKSIILLGVQGLAAPGRKKKPEVEYDVFNPMRVDFNVVTPKTFDTAITKYRSDDASQAVLLYTDYPSAKTFVNDVYQPLAQKLKSIASLSALDCQVYKDYCASLDSSESFVDSPVVYQVPPLPRPVKVHDASISLEDLQKHLLSVIPKHNLVNITVADYDNFTEGHPGVPKIIYFTDKAKAPSSLYAISNSMKDRLDFGMINVSNEGAGKISSRYNITNFPALLALKGGVSEIYGGDLKKAPEVFDWINVRSETFVKGGGFSEGSPEEAPVWTTQVVPELTKDSHGPVCFKQDKICGIVLIPEAELTAEETEMITKGAVLSTPHTDKDIKVKFSYLSLKSEPAFLELFRLEEMPTKPLFTLLKPGKVRFTTPTGLNSGEDIFREIEEVKSGNGRFSKMKFDKLPFSKRSGESDKKEEL